MRKVEMAVIAPEWAEFAAKERVHARYEIRMGAALRRAKRLARYMRSEGWRVTVTEMHYPDKTDGFIQVCVTHPAEQQSPVMELSPRIWVRKPKKGGRQ